MMQQTNRMAMIVLAGWLLVWVGCGPANRETSDAGGGGSADSSGTYEQPIAEEPVPPRPADNAPVVKINVADMPDNLPDKIKLIDAHENKWMELHGHVFSIEAVRPKFSTKLMYRITIACPKDHLRPFGINNFDVERMFFCYSDDWRPWEKLSRFDPVVIRCAKYSWAHLAHSSIVSTRGKPTPEVDLSEFIKDLKANPNNARKKYSTREAIVTCKIAKLNLNGEDWHAEIAGYDGSKIKLQLNAYEPVGFELKGLKVGSQAAFVVAMDAQKTYGNSKGPILVHGYRIDDAGKK